MKRRVIAFGLLCIIATVLLFPQDQIATISPSKPRVGDKITISYNPAAKAATIRDAKELTAEVLVYRDADSQLLLEIPMKQESSIWKGSFKLDEPKSQLLLLQFVSGEEKDDNGENVWGFLVDGKNGKPVRGAHLQRGRVFQYGGYPFKHQKNIEEAKRWYMKEKVTYPDNWPAYTSLWDIWLKENKDDETKAKVKRELDILFKRHKNNQEIAVSFLKYFEQTNQQERADRIREEMLKKDPKGKLAHNKRQNEIYKEKDPGKRAELLEQFLQDFPQTGQKLQEFQNQLASFLVQAKQFDKAIALLNALPKPDAMVYNRAASQLIEKSERLEEAVAWAKKGIEILRMPDPSTKPSYWSTKQAKSYADHQLGMTLDNYATGLRKLGKTAEALTQYEESYAVSKGNNPNINARFVESCIANEKYDRAIQVASECVKKGKTNDELIAHYKTAYTKAKGSEEGFDAVLAEARGVGKKALKEKLLKQRVNKPAIDFTLKSLDGKTVALADLRGKVIVVDFWATWCGPCVASFPHLQKVYDKYKDDPGIVILAVNSWENAKNEEERMKTVKNFIQEKKYTFPVLLDENDKIIGKYGVEGIPTKFIIDKKGVIQFKDIGFEGGQEMTDKMDVQFEMLLSDAFYSSTH